MAGTPPNGPLDAPLDDGAKAGAATRASGRGNARVGLIALSMALGMLGLGFASVPLYRIFCQVTGYGGTTKRVDAAEAAAIKSTGKSITVRFDANVERDMPWQFKPLQRTETVTIGERDMALFWAKNTSGKVVTGAASFNVEPEQAARYFNKIQCFCFTEQVLQPGEAVKMPVVYYVDPAILSDEDNKDVHEITLSYTFHVISETDPKTAAKAEGQSAGKLGRSAARNLARSPDRQADAKVLDHGQAGV